MKRTLILTVLSCALVLPGCKGKQDAAVEQVDKAVDQAVQSAPGPMKARFADLDASIAAKDFAKAKAALDSLLRLERDMTQEQAMALEQRKHDLMVAATAAAQKGDAAAAGIVQGVRGTRGR